MESPFSDMDWLDTASHTLDLAVQKGLYTEFSQSKSDLDRIRFLHTHRTSLFSNTFERYLSANSSSSLTKNPATAINFRKKGNDYFVNKNLSRAAWCYRASIALSNVNSSDMALSYGNLSAVLFELNHYHESIRAIQLANDHYPNELKFKLVFRRAACYHKLNDPERSAYELKICRDLIKQTAGLERKKIESFCKEMDQLSGQIALLNERKEEEHQSYKNLDDLVQHSSEPNETLSECFTRSTKEKIVDEEFRPPSPPSPPRNTFFLDQSKLMFRGINQQLPCASSVVDLAVSREKGRHLLASEDLPSDVLILNERPYACLLLPKFAYTYCDHCLTAIVIPYVCPQCSHVLFCSEHCHQHALATYHQYECQHIHVLKTLGIAFLAYRTLTITDSQTLRTSINTKEENTSIYQSDYKSIGKLLTHSDEMSVDDLFHYSLTAYLLSEILQSTKFFQCDQWKDRDNDQLHLASILLKHIQQMICNAQTISISKKNSGEDILFDYDNDQRDDDDQQELSKRFASAIFPTCALMNHSCIPNIRCVFDQGYLRVYTARPIRRGEEIFNCYGPQKSFMPSNEQRQNILFEQYFFKCQCNGCVELSKPLGEKCTNVKTSTHRKLSQQKTIVKNSVEILPSQSLIVHDKQPPADLTRFYLATTEKLFEAKRLFSNGISSYMQNHSSWDESLQLLNNSFRLYEQILREINLDTVNLYEYIASIYNDRNQLEYTCVYLSKCIRILKMNLTSSCSSTTILLVDVLRKYAQTLFNCRKFDDARRTIIEAQLLLDQMTPTSTLSINDEEKRTKGVQQTIEDLKAKCDLCLS